MNFQSLVDKTKYDIEIQLTFERSFIFKIYNLYGLRETGGQSTINVFNS